MEFQAPHLIVFTVAEAVAVPVISNSVFQTDVQIAPLLGSSAPFSSQIVLCAQSFQESQY